MYISVLANSKSISYASADTIQIEFRDITHIVSVDLFELIKTFVLNKGDRETYSNMYGNNPHYSFDGFESYLNPDIGQLNSDCDTSKSDFNEIVIRDILANPQYYFIRIVRKGDIANEQIITYEGMEENKVYLRNSNDHDNMDSLVNNVSKYLEIIEKEMTTNIIAISKVNINNIEIHPNPSTGFITITIPPGDTGKYRLRLTDMQGQVLQIKEEEITRSYQLDLSVTKPGIYILEIKGKTSGTSKLIVLQ